MSCSNGSPNLIFDRPPECTIDQGLVLTNLNSGASHAATNTILQNIWNAWKRGPRYESSSRDRQRQFDITREVGLVDLNFDALWIDSNVSFGIQLGCLTAQLLCSLIIALTGYSFETFLALALGLAGQTLMLVAIVPSDTAWRKNIRGHRGSAVMFHRSLDTSEVLIIRKATSKGRQISLEEFAWDNQAVREIQDNVRLGLAAISFVLLALEIVIVGWMTTASRVSYLLLGGLGMLSNGLQAAHQPNWSSAFAAAFTGTACCAPPRSSLFAAVGMLLAGEFPGAQESAQLLYPPNNRFRTSMDDLKALFGETLCTECRKYIRTPYPQGQAHGCIGHLQTHPSAAANQTCAAGLEAKIKTLGNKQYRDALAAVAKVLMLARVNNPVQFRAIETTQVLPTDPLHKW